MGGVVAILLGRLGLRVEDAIEAYQRIAEGAFSERKLSREEAFKATKLESIITSVVEQHTAQADAPMANPEGCKTFVCAIQADNITAGTPTLIRTYDVSENDGPKCKIVQAALATTAMMGYFKPITINDSGIGITYVGGELGGNNPTGHMLAEAGRVFVDRVVSCIFSIGAGHLHPINLKSKDVGVAISRDRERVAQEMARRFQYTTDVYFRFNVDQGMQNIGAANWEKMPEVVSHTRQHTTLFEVSSRLTQAAKAFAKADTFIPVAQLGGIIPPTNIVRALRSCPPPSATFVGQEEALSQMAHCIFDGIEGRHIFVLNGLGGAGKTQLALKFAQDYRNK
ncbi:unnamed protein product [Rhizoctonia solani]|uniref:PNPLA domain-containing protein n=1 Tax=Rhizoctonia solani TaxID=456999 RepID=A0A8H2XA40_9AGAM|nr:unnamed protein product [Rhizoctonia solani]